MAISESLLQVAVLITCSLLLLYHFSQLLLCLLQRLSFFVELLFDVLLLLLLSLTGLMERVNHFSLICQLAVLVI